MQAARLCELLYSLDVRLVLLKRQLVRASGYCPEDDSAQLHCKVVELSQKKEQVAQEKLQVVKSFRHGALQLGKGISISRPLCTLLRSVERLDITMLARKAWARPTYVQHHKWVFIGNQTMRAHCCEIHILTCPHLPKSSPQFSQERSAGATPSSIFR